jgi:DNA-binding LytR/AlgR family response regulator
MAGRAEALAQAEQAQGSHDDGIWVPTRGGAVFVPTETIDWIEAQRDYVMLHTATRSHIIRMSMRALEEKLDPAQLVRVHRSAFARPSNVVEVQRMGKTINALVLRDGAIVQVGPNYSKAVAERLKLAG